MTQKTLLIAALILGVGATSYAADGLVLKHRYSFEPTYTEEGIEIIKDSVGQADGTVYGGAYCMEIYDEQTGDPLGTALFLDGVGDTRSMENGSFVNLPADIMQSPSYAVEAWVRAASDLGNWARIWDFGNNQLNEDGTIYGGVEYTMLAWKNGGEETVHSVRFEGAETQLVTPAFPRGGEDFHHVVHTYDATTKIGSLYLDGNLVVQGTQNGDPTTFVGGMPNMFIGKSNFADSYFKGEILEFRIYDGAMDIVTLKQNYEAGPDVIPDPQESTGLEVVAGKTTINVKERTPITVYSVLEDGTKVDVTTSATLSSVNTNIATVANGAARGVAIGDVTINAQFEGALETITISVVDYVPELTLQNRYSFNGNANDSVGGANGTLENGATISGGKLVLTPASNAAADAQTVSLPAGLFADHMATTMEIWAQTDNQSHDFNNSFLYAFHNTPPGNEYFNLAARISGGSIVSHFSTVYSTTTLTSSGMDDPLIQGELTHLVVVADGFTGKVSCYKNGRMFMEGDLDSAPMDLPTDLLYNKLGWSGYANDPGFFGKIDEFRIWKGAMTAEQVRTSYASGADTLPPTDRGELTALHITPRDGVTSIPEDSKIPFTLTADYTNVKNVLLSATDATVTSSVTDVVNILIDGNQGYLEGLIAGKSTITAAIDQISTTIDITVTERDPAILTHRYSFDNDVSDSVGHANGELMGDAYIENGYVRIDGSIVNSIANPSSEANNPPYVKLPANLISDHASVTIETWVTLDSLDMWARIYDFGCKSGTAGTKYMLFAPQNGTIGGTSGNFVTTGQGAAEQVVGKSGYYMPAGKMVHMVITVDSANDRGCLYIDGKRIVDKEGISNNPAVIGAMDNCWLGRSLFDADRILVGNIHEFRTYKGVLTSKDVAVNTINGPETLSTDLGEFQGLRVVPSATTMTPGGTISFSVYADYTNVKDVLFNAVKGVEISVDNEAITLVDEYSVTSSVYCKGNIIVEYLGERYTAAVEFAEAGSKLVHRYSFNDSNYSDVIKDSVGTLNAYNWYGMAIENGALIMDGKTTVDIERGVLNEVAGGAFAIEAWMDIDSNEEGNWSSFNYSFYSEDYMSSAGSTLNSFALGLQPNKGGNSKNHSTWALIEMPAGEGTAQYKAECFAPKGHPGAGVIHSVYLLDPDRQQLILYINGRLESLVNINITPERLAAELPTYAAKLGGSFENLGLPGKMLEFRIWKGALTAKQIAANYIAGPDMLADTTVKAQNVEICTPETLYVDGTTLMQIYADYANAPRVDITQAPDITVKSSNTDVLVIDSSRRLVPVAPGTATITAVVDGAEFSADVNVEASDVATLLHRYSFNGSAEDSIDGADAVLYGNATITDEQLVLDGSRQAFARVPEGVISGLKEMTWEVWFTPGTYIANWNRLLDFGDNYNTGDQAGYLFVSIYTGGANVRVATRPPGGDEQFRSIATPNMQSCEGQTFHLVFTYEENGNIVGYLNGQPVSTTGSNNRKLSEISDYQNYIGRSAFLVDPAIAVSVDEFRIWNGLLSPEQIALNYATGPDVIDDPAGDKLQSLEVKIFNSEFFAGEAQEVKVIGTYSKTGEVDVTSKATIVADGSFIIDGTRIYASAPGAGTITAELDGITSKVVELNAAETTYELKHRYSFDGDATDSVGDADGIAYNTTFADGIASLSGEGNTDPNSTDGSFIDLPDNIMNYSSYTIEAWARAGEGCQHWGRIWDFGNSIGDKEYTMAAWVANLHSVKYQGVEKQLTSLGLPAAGTQEFTHVVYTYDSATQTGSFYVNGMLAKSGTQYGDPTSFVAGMDHMYIGKSNWPDPFFKGDFQEFRIWRGAIPNSQIQANYTAGPEEIGKDIQFNSIEIEVNANDPVLLSGYVGITVWGYSDDAQVDLTGEAIIEYTDNLQRISAGEFIAIASGDAAITATYKDLADIQAFTVADKSYELKHRYSFNGDATDSVGDADGIAYNVTFADGIATLSGEGNTDPNSTDGSFIDLPDNIMECSSYTIETWATAFAGNQGWGRVWDFGNSIGDKEYTMLAWGNGVHSVKYQGAEKQISGMVFPAAGDGIYHHIVYTYDRITKTGSIYIDGAFIKSAEQIGDPTTFVAGMDHMYIGKSNWPDPFFKGGFAEFRIYDGALTEAEVVANFQAGPEVIPTPVVEDPTIDFTVEDGELVLRWSGDVEALAEVAPTVNGPWTALEPAELIGGAFQIRVPITSQAAFFRLRK